MTCRQVTDDHQAFLHNSQLFICRWKNHILSVSHCFKCNVARGRASKTPLSWRFLEQSTLFCKKLRLAPRLDQHGSSGRCWAGRIRGSSSLIFTSLICSSLIQPVASSTRCDHMCRSWVLLWKGSCLVGCSRGVARDGTLCQDGSLF